LRTFFEQWKKVWASPDVDDIFQESLSLVIKIQAWWRRIHAKMETDDFRW
jgi:hypothetical protein